MKILFDANALMMPAQFSIDLFDELRQLIGAFEPLVLDVVVRELAGISSGKGRDAAAARYGLEIVKKCTKVLIEELSVDSVDQQIVNYAKKHGCIVVTNDRHLRQILVSQRIGVISMRKQKRLELIKS